MPFVNTVQDINPNWKFTLTFTQGFVDAGFSKASGLEIDTDEIEYREGKDPSTPTKFAGQTKYPNIVLERGQLTNLDAFAAVGVVFDKTSGQGSANYKFECFINQQDRTGVIVRQWKVNQAWVKNWKLSDLDASTSELVMETITLAHEGLEEVS